MIRAGNKSCLACNVFKCRMLVQHCAHVICIVLPICRQPQGATWLKGTRQQICELRLNQTTFVMTATGGEDIQVASVRTALGDVPAACDVNDFPVTAVKRTFDISTYNNAPATMRFYYRAAEANGLAPAQVGVYHCDGVNWTQLAGPYSRGSEGGMEYVEVVNSAGFSPFALGMVTDEATSTPTAVNKSVIMIHLQSQLSWFRQAP